MLPKRLNPLVPLLLTTLLTACNFSTVVGDDTSEPQPTPAQRPGNTPAPIVGTAVPTGEASTSPPLAPATQRGLWLHPGLPTALVDALSPLLDDPTFTLVATPEEAALSITLFPGDSAPLRTTWLYAVVAPFPTIPDGIGWEGLGRYWQGDTNALPDFGGPLLLLSPDVAEVLTIIYGSPAPNTPITVVPAEQVLDQAWASPPALSLVPFEQLEPRWKVLAVDGASPLDKTLSVADYPFAVEIGLTGDPTAAAQAADLLTGAGAWPPTNFDSDRMSIVTMTGVTALSRAVAWQMELSGIEAQGEQIKPLLSDADILHISNEVAFALDCPPPDPNGDPVFCSDDRYMALLRDLGPSVIELTGNHINDWGTGALLHTLDIYDQNAIPYFGGGRDLEDAQRPVLIENSGNRIAFLGCNLPGPNKAYATAQTPGAWPCEDYAAFHAMVGTARDQADVVIATQQYWEFEHPDPTPQQVADFAAIVEAGADIVSGSQAHQPQTLAFHDGRFVHYGLSNLFFDPFEDVEKDFFIDRHVIYDGRHVSTVLLTGRIENYGRPRPMTPDERRQFLAAMFAASSW